MKHLSSSFAALAAILGLAGACAGTEAAGDGTPPPGGGPGGDGTASPPASGATSAPTSALPPPPATKSGALLFARGAPIAGVTFTAGTKAGTTDAHGAFTYDEGQVVVFHAGSVLLGSATGAAVISPYQLAGSAKCDDTGALVSLVALLEALDADGDAANGITVPAGSTGAPSRALPADPVALRTFITAFDGEAWSALGTDTFSYGDAIVRGQGIATDGTSWFFSGTTGLERTNAGFSTASKSTFAIPLVLAAQGSDHIGDIDFWGGKIYAPVEDKTYAAPKVVLYDPSSLGAGTVYDVPVSLQTKGVPWIAVDGPRGVAYMAEWDPTPAIHEFSLATMTFTRALPLATPTGRVQGGKVWKGQLYLSTDDAAKHVYKVHLASGTIFPLFALNADVEMEGLAFFPRSDGSLLHTLDVTTARTGVELRHHKITREPLRWTVCP